MTRKLIPLLFAASVAWAQEPGTLFDKVQIHGTLSQGFLFTSANNYLSTESSEGSLRWTEGALNFSAAISDQLHIGLQFHSYSLGLFGRQRVELDWAYGDYKLNDYLGFRAGKVKSPTGIYNDIQDIDTLYPWALLPQSIYPADNRSSNLSHTGVVVYGGVHLPARAGLFTYQIFAGSRTLEQDGGYALLLSEFGIPFKEGHAPVYGVDVRWKTPITGLTIGSTIETAHSRVTGETRFSTPYAFHQVRGRLENDFVQYERGKLLLAAEWHQLLSRFQTTGIPPLPPNDGRGWYVMASYHYTERLTLGTYYSSSLNNYSTSHHDPTNYAKDIVLNSRFDVNQYFYLKLEGHFIRGNGIGFYQTVNPGGLEKNTGLLVARIGFTF